LQQDPLAPLRESAQRQDWGSQSDSDPAFSQRGTSRPRRLGIAKAASEYTAFGTRLAAVHGLFYSSA